MAAAMVTGELWFKVPETIKFVYHGSVRPGWTGKDLILYTIGEIGVDGARYLAMEFTGEAIAGLSMDDRLTMANMAIEAGGKNGIIAPDEVTKELCQTRAERPYTVLLQRCRRSTSIRHDVERIEPQVSFPHLPSKREADQRGRGHPDRPGRHRLLHQRPD